MPRHRLAYFGFFLLALSVSLAATMPASYAVRLFGLTGGPFMLVGASGTVWSGQAARALYAGRDLGGAHWQFDPAALLRGCLGWKARIAGTLGRAVMRVRTCPGNRVVLSSVSAEADAARLMRAAGAAPVAASGKVRVRLERVAAVQGWPREIRGKVVWHDAALDGTIDAKLGNITARVRTENGEIVARISGKGGAGRVDGVLRLGRSGRYQVRASVGDALAERLHLKELLGSADVRRQDGVYDLRLSGILHPRAPAP